MNNDLIQNLLEALKLSPENVPLRLQVAEMMKLEKMYEEAIENYKTVLERQPENMRAQSGLAESYFYVGKYSTAIIVYEQMAEMQHIDKVLFTKSLIKENAIGQAIEMYQEILSERPHFSDNEIDNALRMPSGAELNDMLDDIGSGNNYFLEKPDIKFVNVGGMQRVKNEISLKIIQPLKNPDLFKAFGKKSGGGILLYGPPGCGKTFIAKATAGEIDAKFISIGLHDILDMWIGNSEKNLHEIFEIARNNKPCVLFFDEADALGASRSDLKQSAMRHVINQFLAELDGVNSNNEGVLILAATNAPWSIDPAFRRPGRFDRVIFVSPPDLESRMEILSGILATIPCEPIDIKKIAESSNEYSGADLKAITDLAVEEKLLESLNKGTLQKVTTKDLLNALKKHRPTTKEWFASARNYALYANESGLYDEILHYLKLKK